MKTYSVKKSIIIMILFFMATGFTACTEESGYKLPKDDTHGSITFTARGENVTCTPDYNEAIFQKTEIANYKRRDFNILIIQSYDENAPENHVSSISLHMITTGSLEKGTCPIIDQNKLTSYYYGSVHPDPDKVASGVAKVKDQPYNPKGIYSTGGGQLVINDITLGKYHPGEVKGEHGYTKGFISGTFAFTGSNLHHTSTGSCMGKFENVPIKIYDVSK